MCEDVMPLLKFHLIKITRENFEILNRQTKCQQLLDNKNLIF